MKLVDTFYVSKKKPLTEEEQMERSEMEREKRRLQTAKAVADARVKREDAAKMKAMKKHLFGKFITRVPVLKEDRYLDMPLPDSSAVPYEPEPLPLSELGKFRERCVGPAVVPGVQRTNAVLLHCALSTCSHARGRLRPDAFARSTSCR